MIQNEAGSPLRRVLAHPGPVDERLAKLLAAAGLRLVACPSGEELRGEVTTGAGALLIDAEALACPEMAGRLQDLPRPARGTDLPLLILARPGSSAMAIAREWAAAGDLTVLDPSVPPELLASAVGAAVRARERCSAEAAGARRLQAERDALRALAEHTDAHLAYLDPEFRFLEVNAACARGCGHRREELLGRGHFELFPNAENQGHFERVRETGEPARFHARPFEFPDDPARRVAYWDWTLAPVDGPDGRLAGLVLSLTDVTDPWRSGQEVRKSEERFRRLAETSPVGLVIGDVHGGLSYLNPAALTMLGYTEEEAAGGRLRWDELTPPEYGPRDVEAVAELQAVGSCRPYEKAYVAKDGTRVPILVGASVLSRAADGEPLVAAFVTDLRPLRRAEEALRSTEERLLLAVESAGLGTWELRPGSGAVEWSDRNKALWGLPSGAEITYPAFLSRVHPGEREQVHRATEQALQPEGSGRYEQEHRIVRPDGEVRWIATRGQAFFQDGPEGRRAVRMAGISLDVTNRRAAEEAYRASVANEQARAAEIQAIMEAVPAVVWIAHDPECRRITGNRAADELLRLPGGVNASLSAPAGERPSHFRVCQGGVELAPEDLPVQAAARGREIRGFEEELVFADGEVRHLLGNATPLWDAAGSPRGAVAAFLDITERVTMEAELRRSKAAAEAANRAKSDFLAKMSHEIRTPLNGVLGMTELALLTGVPAQAQEYLHLAKKSARSLLDIINDILDLSKIEAGRVELEARPFDLWEVLEVSLSPLAVAAQAKGLRLYQRVSPGVPRHLVGDRGRLSQVLVNLVGNAVKFTDRGEVEVSLDAEAQGAETAVLRFGVRDTGIGIPASEVETVFKSFSQAAASAHARFGGTGLGLTISRQLAELMGGGVAVASREGEGSTFTFTARFGVAAAGGETEVPPDRASALTGSAPLRILVAEDDPLNQIFTQALLEQSGHQVVLAENGLRVLEELRRGTFDLVLMDVQMPVMDGPEATRRIRSGEVPGVARDLPIVALTAHALEEDRARFLACGMDDYLSKPFTAEELARVLAEAVAEAPGRTVPET